MRRLVIGLMTVCSLISSGAHAAEYVLFGPGSVSAGVSAVYSALSFDPFSSNRFQGFWDNPAYGTFRDPDRPPGVAVYDGGDGENVTLRLWFTGVDFSSLGAVVVAYFGAANVGQTNPCYANSATTWGFWYDNDGRVYTFKAVQVDEAGLMGFGPARGWNPSTSGLPIENKFDMVLEFVPSSTSGELRVYGFQKRYYSTETYHYAPGRWIPMHYAWGLVPEELDPKIKDPSETGPQWRYYNRFAGYPYASSMNVFAGIGAGGPGDALSWAQIKAEGTSCGPNQVSTIAGAKKARISGVYDIGTARFTADFRARNGLIFVRQLDGSSGIGIRPDGVTLPEQINVGDRLQASGYTKVEGGAEVVLVANQITISPADPGDPPIKPLGLSSRASGGGAMGCQPGATDDATILPPKNAAGLSTLGQLVRMWGSVTGSAQVQTAEGTVNAFWLDDGGMLRDGFTSAPQLTGVAVALPPDWSGSPPSGCCAVVGILRPAANPQGRIVRMLFPRTAADVVQHAPPP